MGKSVYSKCMNASKIVFDLYFKICSLDSTNAYKLLHTNNIKNPS